MGRLIFVLLLGPVDEDVETVDAVRVNPSSLVYRKTGL
jgi:hypothetical protein